MAIGGRCVFRHYLVYKPVLWTHCSAFSHPARTFCCSSVSGDNIQTKWVENRPLVHNRQLCPSPVCRPPWWAGRGRTSLADRITAGDRKQVKTPGKMSTLCLWRSLNTLPLFLCSRAGSIQSRTFTQELINSKYKERFAYKHGGLESRLTCFWPVPPGSTSDQPERPTGLPDTGGERTPSLTSCFLQHAGNVKVWKKRSTIWPNSWRVYVKIPYPRDWNSCERAGFL